MIRRVVRADLGWSAVLLAAAVLVVGTAKSEAPKGWTADGASVRSEERNKKTVHIATATRRVGYLWLDGVTFRDGTVEVELKGTGVFGIALGDPKEPEQVVVRPALFGKAGAAAIEYIPAAGHGQAVSSPNVKSPIRADDWFAVKVDVKAKELRVFVGESSESSLTIARKSRPGSVGINIHEGGEGSFADFKVTPFDDSVSPTPRK